MAHQWLRHGYLSTERSPDCERKVGGLSQNHKVPLLLYITFSPKAEP